VHTEQAYVDGLVPLSVSVVEATQELSIAGAEVSVSIGCHSQRNDVQMSKSLTLEIGTKHDGV